MRIRVLRVLLTESSENRKWLVIDGSMLECSATLPELPATLLQLSRPNSKRP
jgi:hypothetical protein